MIHNYTAMPRAWMDKLLPSLAQWYTCSHQFQAWTGIFQFTAISRPALQPTQYSFSSLNEYQMPYCWGYSCCRMYKRHLTL